MPVLHVEIVGKETLPDAAQRIADGAGEVLGSEPRGTWVKVSYVAESEYAENGGRDETLRPVFVTLMQGEVPETKALASQLTQLSRAIAQATGRPAENVHVFVEPAGRGRVAFGGRLVT